MHEVIEKLLAALHEGTAVADGVLLTLGCSTVMTIERRENPVPQAVLTFDPPPELLIRRGPISLRCTLPRATVTGDEIHLAIEGWFDRRIKVSS